MGGETALHTCTHGNNKHRLFERAGEPASQPPTRAPSTRTSRKTKTAHGLVAIMPQLQYAQRYVHRSSRENGTLYNQPQLAFSRRDTPPLFRRLSGSIDLPLSLTVRFDFRTDN